MKDFKQGKVKAIVNHNQLYLISKQSFKLDELDDLREVIREAEEYLQEN